MSCGLVQFMRQKAQEAGNLKTTPQQTVTDQGSDVDIQPANPQVVYVPEYDPELIYGYPVGLWPGFYPWWGVGRPISFVRRWLRHWPVLRIRLGLAGVGLQLGRRLPALRRRSLMPFTVKPSMTATPTFTGITEASPLTRAVNAAHAVLPRPGPEAMPAREPEAMRAR
jgi:hypothetical protein